MTSRAAIFSGTEAPPPHLALDLPRLSAYLAEQMEGTGGPLEAMKFKGGQSNPTYLLTQGGRKFVLRRKPPGKLVESAHAIDREYRVLAALAKAGFAVPRPHLYCADESVIGSEFFIVDYLQGRIFWEAELPGVSPPDRGAIYGAMNATLARLHDLDVDAIGLAGFGRVGGYCLRNFTRWAGIYDQSRLIDIPEMDWLIQHLPTRMPRNEPTALIHGDYGLYNIIIDAAQPKLMAVLDWEMATLGDPFVDLAHHVRAWWDSPDSGGAATSLVGMDLPAFGIPSMQAYIEAYCGHRQLAVPDMTFYLGYAQFRYAAMIQGILKRAKDGTASGRVVLHRQERVAEIARLARRTLEGR